MRRRAEHGSLAGMFDLAITLEMFSHVEAMLTLSN